MKTFGEIINETKDNLIKAITNVVKDNNNLIYIPYYFDEDEWDDNLQELSDDGYNLKTGNSGENLNLEIEIFWGIKENRQIVAIAFQENKCYIIDNEQKTYYLTDIIGIENLNKLYEKIISI